MPSPEARLKKLEKLASKLQKQLKTAKLETNKVRGDLAKAKKDYTKAKKSLEEVTSEVESLRKEVEQIIEWIEAEAAWSQEVTALIRMINWGALATQFPGGGGTNPPQTGIHSRPRLAADAIHHPTTAPLARHRSPRGGAGRLPTLHTPTDFG
jgi:uncharacterized protein YeeX (DUF496 family)